MRLKTLVDQLTASVEEVPCLGDPVGHSRGMSFDARRLFEERNQALVSLENVFFIHPFCFEAAAFSNPSIHFHIQKSLL